MGNITYVRGNLLKNDNDKKRIIIHSCNCQGVWGGGFAYQLGQIFPKTELEYTNICDNFSASRKLLGEFVIIPSFTNSKTLICCLFTSFNSGGQHDTEESILLNTEKSLKKLIKYLQNGKKYCPPPNSPSKESISSFMPIQNGNGNNNDEDDESLKQLLELMNEEYFSQFDEINDLKHFELQMPKINSGIFSVPWEKTESILKTLPRDFKVYDL